MWYIYLNIIRPFPEKVKRYSDFEQKGGCIMEKIESFKVDHRYIVPGIYLSRVDGDVATYDLRFKKPNAGDYLTDLELHSLEHMFATYARNGRFKDRVIYFGPMGCRTGFYLLLRGLPPEDVRAIVKETLEKIVFEADEMFGCSEIECGNYRELSLAAAKTCAASFLSAVDIDAASFIYPRPRKEDPQ